MMTRVSGSERGGGGEGVRESHETHDPPPNKHATTQP